MIGISRSIRLAQRLIRVSALEDRIKLIIQKYPGIPAQTIQSLAKLDPGKGVNLEWLVRQIKSGVFNHPEDDFRMIPALETYLKLKKSPRLLTEHQISPDINKYTFHDLEEIHDRLTGQSLKTQRETTQEAKVAGTQVIYDKEPYKIIQVGGPGVNPDQAADAMCTYAKETKWCVSNKPTAQAYLKKGPLYLIFRDGVKLALTNKSTLMDVLDKQVSIEKDPHLWSFLTHQGIIDPAFYAYETALRIVKGPYPGVESIIAKSPQFSYLYAKYVLHGRFPEGEKAILTSPNNAVYYAKDVLKRRWSEAEPIIKTDPYAIISYAKEFFKNKRWLEVEPIILKSPEDTVFYVLEVIKAVKGEPYAETLRREFPEALKVIASDLYAASDFVMETQERFPEGETALASTASSAYWYSVWGLGMHRFPAGEPAILKSPGFSYLYAGEVIGGRWPEAEPVIMNSPYQKLYEDGLRTGDWKTYSDLDELG